MTFLKEPGQQKLKTQDDLKKTIEKAIQKVRGTKENDLCKFIPGPTGGYMHHFTLRKMKTSSPQELATLLQEFIIDATAPKTLHPKQRAPRGSRKRKDLVTFNRVDMEKLVDLARKAGYTDLVAKFSPKRSITSLKRELIRSIRENRVNQELWNSYVEMMAMSKANQNEI